MLSVFLILLLVGVAVSDKEHGWIKGKEYTYEINSRTLSALHDVADQYTGILMQGFLTIQAKESDILIGKIEDAEYAQIHTMINGTWDSKIPDEEVNFEQFPISTSPFEIKLKNGVVQDVIVDESVPTWEVNFLKSIISQLQLDLRGENAIRHKYNQMPEEDGVLAMYSVMEGTITGKCEVLYDISPFPKSMVHSNSRFVPMPQLQLDEDAILIVKTQNFSNCEQRVDYHSGFSENNNYELGSNENGQFLSRSSVGRFVISGTLKNFVIQSTETVDQILMRPGLFEIEQGMVSSKVNLTLKKFGDVKEGLQSPGKPESTGNLVYTFNSPFGSEHDKEVKHSVASNAVDNNDFWQPKPKLDRAPDIPLLPYFVGKDGHFPWKSNEADFLVMVKNFIGEIADEIEDPNNMMDAYTLEKMTILTNLIRTMNTEQIDDIKKSVYVPKSDLSYVVTKDKLMLNKWSVFRDAVAIAGTGPALKSIKSWIQQNVLRSDAMNTLFVLPDSVLTPTPEYIDEFFDIITIPEITKRPQLQYAAILSFVDLIRLTVIEEKSAHNRYPVHTFGNFMSKKNDAVFKKYIPYLASQLKEAVADGNSPKIQVFIAAIGRIGHPRILSIFEPYLEGKQHMSKFQRTWMVLSLNKLAVAWPRIARPVLYKIYMNTGDDYEVRCAAVFLLMLTNPPVSMLQRMADFTKYDRSQHVSSAVKSSIESAAQLDDDSELARNARAAVHLLNPREFDYFYSQNYLVNFASKDMRLSELINLNAIGSDDSILPKHMFLGVKAVFGGISFPSMAIGGSISSWDNLILIMENIFEGGNNKNKNPGNSKWAPEKLAEILKVEADDPEQLEGNIFYDSLIGRILFPFDNHTLEAIPHMLKNVFEPMKKGLHFNEKSFISSDLTLSFPTGSGFPFVFTLNIPGFMNIVSESHTNSEHKVSDKTGLPVSANINVELSIVYTTNILGRMGFVTPFEHKHYMAGFDKHVQYYLPIYHEATYDVEKNRFSVQFQPLAQGKSYKLFQMENVPFTTKLNIMKLEPVKKCKHTKIVTDYDILSYKFRPGLGIMFESYYEDKEDASPLQELSAALKNLLMPWMDSNMVYTKNTLMWTSDLNTEQLVKFSVAYDSMNSQSNEVGDKAIAKRDVEYFTVSDKEKDSETRRKKMLRDSLQSMNFGHADVLDIGIEFLRWKGIDVTMTFAYANSNVDRKSRILSFVRAMFEGKDNNAIEVCTRMDVDNVEIPILDPRKILTSNLSSGLDISFGYGNECTDAGFKIHGNLKRSEERKNDILQRPEAEKCLKENENGNKALIVCDDIVTLATLMDELEISFTFNDNSFPLKSIMLRGIESAKDYLDVNAKMNALNPKNKDDDKIEFNIKMTPEDTINVVAYTPNVDIEFQPIDLVATTQQHAEMEFHSKQTEWINSLDQEAREDKMPGCILDKSAIKTFDEKIYSVELGKCWHVFLMTYPKEDPDNPNKKLPIPEDMRISVLARDIGNGEREIKVVLGPNEVSFSPATPEMNIKVNDRNVQVSHDKSFQQLEEDDEIGFEIFSLTEDSYKLTSEKYEIEVVFDGKHMHVEAADMYRKSIRGLCGNYDGEIDDDFETPQMCMKKHPEEFAASWALTKEDCDGPALKYTNEDQATCTRQEPRPSNVISDEDAGRSDG